MAIGDMISHAKQKIITNGEGYLLGHSETPLHRSYFSTLQCIVILKKYIYSETYEIVLNSCFKLFLIKILILMSKKNLGGRHTGGCLPTIGRELPLNILRTRDTSLEQNHCHRDCCR